MRDRAGEALFARYAYPPNELGYCGAGDGSDLLDAASGVTDGVAVAARSFEGAWPYLEMIAAAAGADPLDRRVVEAYWVGNELLDAIDPATFAETVQATFASQRGADWGCLGAVPAPQAHHGFHVLAVYPWTGLLRRGAAGPALGVLDRCRIRWGTVVGVSGDHASVRSRALSWDGAAVSLAEPRIEEVRWAAGGRSLLGSVSPGDVVSMHWDWVCDTLDPAQASALEAATARQLRATNESAVATRAAG